MIPEEIVLRDKGEKIKLIQEVWVPCFFDKNYLVSNLGLVKRFRKINKKSKEIMPDKYLSVGTYNRYYEVSLSGKSYKLHQVVYYSFFPEEYVKRNREYCIDHINGIKEDNRLVNLRLLNWLQNCDKANKDASNGLF